MGGAFSFAGAVDEPRRAHAPPRAPNAPGAPFCDYCCFTPKSCSAAPLIPVQAFARIQSELVRLRSCRTMVVGSYSNELLDRTRNRTNDGGASCSVHRRRHAPH